MYLQIYTLNAVFPLNKNQTVNEASTIPSVCEFDYPAISIYTLSVTMNASVPAAPYTTLHIRGFIQLQNVVRTGGATILLLLNEKPSWALKYINIPVHTCASYTLIYRFTQIHTYTHII